jgi:apolipoprotein N-acyltransferase
MGVVFRTLLAGGLVAGLTWLAIGQLPADIWAWTLGLAAIHVILYVALIFAFRVVSLADLRPAMGNLLRLKG